MHRTRTHKLCVYHGKGVGVFDLENDPWEHENLWDDPAHAEVKYQLLAESFDAHVLLYRCWFRANRPDVTSLAQLGTL